MIDRIQARRDALAAQIAEAQQEYDQLESMLCTLDRQLCAMHGGLQELDALLAAPEVPECISPYATGLNGAREAALEGIP